VLLTGAALSNWWSKSINFRILYVVNYSVQALTSSCLPFTLWLTGCVFCFCMQLIPDDMEFQSGDVPNYTTSDGSVCLFLYKWFLLFFSSSVTTGLVSLALLRTSPVHSCLKQVKYLFRLMIIPFSLYIL
jgi:hypothetical protein